MPTPPRPETGLTSEQKLSRYLTLAKRALGHWPLAALIFSLAVAVSVGVAMTRVRYYRSETLIYYKEEMRKDLLSGPDQTGGERDLAHRLHQLLWSRTRLMKLIKELNLYPELRAAKTDEEVVEAMRNAIQVREKGGDTFWVSYEYRDPRTTQQVTQRLADTFVEETARDAVDRSRATAEFIQVESGKARQDFDKATSDLARFYEIHPELVPERDADPRAPGAAVRAIGKAARHAARRPRMVIKGASPELRALLAEKGRLEAQLSILQGQQRGPTATEQELAEVRRTLSDLRARFSDAYPDVASARARVARLERRVAADRRYGGSDSEAGRIRGEMARLDSEIARLGPRAKKVDDDGGRDKPGARVEADTTERVETEYNRLIQAYEVAKARTAALSDKQLQARVLSNLEAQQQQATFRIVDPAYLPEKAVRPSRRKIVFLGAFFGLLLGGAAAGARVLLDPRVYDETDLLDLGPLPVLAQVPREGERAKG